MSNFPAPSVTWSDVARACRRVCVLRERGLNEEAERVRATEVISLVAALRTEADSDAGITERLNSLFATEAERVANAAVLAELLVPTLAEQLRPGTTTAARPAPAIPAAAANPAPRPASIADFIDDMIAQERPPDRPGNGAHRRAS